MPLFPAEHRGLRELQAAVRHLTRHWTRLATRLGDPSLAEGASAADALLVALTEQTHRRGLEGFPGAQGSGGAFAALRNGAGDRLLERNQALRAAVLDVQHVVTLLGYLGELAAGRDDVELAAFHREWEARLRRVDDDARAVAVAAGSDPELAVAPADPGLGGRAGHRVAYALGSLGEAVDGSPVGALVRRLRRR